MAYVSWVMSNHPYFFGGRCRHFFSTYRSSCRSNTRSQKHFTCSLLSLLHFLEAARLLHVLILDSGVTKYLASTFWITETKSEDRKEYAMVHADLTCQLSWSHTVVWYHTMFGNASITLVLPLCFTLLSFPLIFLPFWSFQVAVGIDVRAEHCNKIELRSTTWTMHLSVDCSREENGSMMPRMILFRYCFFLAIFFVYWRGRILLQLWSLMGARL
jgi:hypothetical protein